MSKRAIKLRLHVTPIAVLLLILFPHINALANPPQSEL